MVSLKNLWWWFLSPGVVAEDTGGMLLTQESAGPHMALCRPGNLRILQGAWHFMRGLNAPCPGSFIVLLFEKLSRSLSLSLFFRLA